MKTPSSYPLILTNQNDYYFSAWICSSTVWCCCVAPSRVVYVRETACFALYFLPSLFQGKIPPHPHPHPHLLEIRMLARKRNDLEISTRWQAFWSLPLVLGLALSLNLIFPSPILISGLYGKPELYKSSYIYAHRHCIWPHSVLLWSKKGRKTWQVTKMKLIKKPTMISHDENY